MDELFETAEKRINNLIDDLKNLKSVFSELQEKKKQRDEELSINNPFMNFFRLKKEIFDTNESYTKSFYSNFIEELKTFVSEFNGIEDEEYLDSKCFISKLITDSNGDFYTYFKEFVNNDKISSFVKELKLSLEQNGCKILDFDKEPDIKETDGYKDFETNLLKLISVISKRRYSLNASDKEIGDFKERINKTKDEDNSKQ